MIKRWIARLLNVERHIIIEVEKPRSVGELSPEMHESVTSLGAHPGFQHLLAKLRLERARLESALKYTKHESLSAVHVLQGGVYWAGWLERQLVKDVLKAPVSIEQGVAREEHKILEEIESAITRVGHVIK